MTGDEGNHYVQCGLRLRSEIDLALPRSRDREWDVDIRWGEDRDDLGPPTCAEPIASYGQGEDAWYVVVASDEGFTIWFRNCGEFSITANCTRVAVHPHKSGRREILPILLAGTVSAVLLNLRGATLLHASAVTRGGGVLGFVGQSGRGKSTLAALMCVAGAGLVADDLLSVRAGTPPSCIGGADALRLRSKAFGIAQNASPEEVRRTQDDRLAFTPSHFTGDWAELIGIVIPSPSVEARSLTFDLLRPSQALMALLAFPRVHGWTLPDVLNRDFTVIGQLVNNVPVWNATIPWGPPFDPSIATAIAENVGWDSESEPQPL